MWRTTPRGRANHSVLPLKFSPQPFQKSYSREFQPQCHNQCRHKSPLPAEDVSAAPEQILGGFNLFLCYFYTKRSCFVSLSLLHGRALGSWTLVHFCEQKGLLGFLERSGRHVMKGRQSRQGPKSHCQTSASGYFHSFPSTFSFMRSG